MKKSFCLLLLLFLCLSFAFAEDRIPLSTRIEDLNGRRIGVQTAVLYEELIKDRVPDTEFMYFTMPNDMILALQSGRISAYLIEQVGYGVQKLNCPQLECLEEIPGEINASSSLETEKKRTGFLQNSTHS